MLALPSKATVPPELVEPVTAAVGLLFAEFDQAPAGATWATIVYPMSADWTTYEVLLELVGEGEHEPFWHRAHAY